MAALPSAAPSFERVSGPVPEPRRVRAALLRKVAGNEAMFALGSAVARVVQMAASDDRCTHDLAYYVLADSALTQRILRLANTVRYRTASGSAVTTVSRAISLLGFDNVRTTALAMLLVEALGDDAHAGAVRTELEVSLCAGLAGRELARHGAHPGAEEAAIGALFKNLGPLLVASYEPERYREIAALAAAGGHSHAQAARMILGCSYDALSEAVLDEWGIPDAIARAQRPPPEGRLQPGADRAEWMRQAAAFSLDVAQLLVRTGMPADTPEAQALLARYGAAMQLGSVEFADLFGNVAQEMRNLMQSLQLQPVRTVPHAQPAQASAQSSAQSPAQPSSLLPDVLVLATLGTDDAAPAGWHPSGKPRNAGELLLAGVQDVTQLRATGQGSVNDVVLAVLETLYAAMGFRFATVVLKDLRSSQYRARVSFGARREHLQAGFVFPAAPPSGQRPDLFQLALDNDADLMIADAATPKIRDLLPAWHRALLPDAASFIVLPLVVGKARLGMFYADRTEPAPEGVPGDETSLIKALKGQVLAVLAPHG